MKQRSRDLSYNVGIGQLRFILIAVSFSITLTLMSMQHLPERPEMTTKEYIDRAEYYLKKPSR